MVQEMKRLLTVGALFALVLAASAHGESKAPGRVTTSRLVDGGHFRITVTVGTPAQVGHLLRIRYRIRNVSKVTRSIQLAYTSLWYAVRNADGVQFDTRSIWYGFGPRMPPTKLRPGGEITRTSFQERARWSGPLRITPGWANEPLPSVRIEVKTPGAPASSRSAVAQVVAATGRLLDHCRPRVAGVAVIGRIDAPQNSAPPMATRCVVSIRRKTGFDVAQVVITTPRKARAHVGWQYETIRFPSGHGNREAIAWQFVVTKNGATSVAAASVEATRQAKKMAPDWEWTSAGHGSRPGGSRCGGTGGSSGGSTGPSVQFVSICR
jgi:hypothetical protein